MRERIVSKVEKQLSVLRQKNELTTQTAADTIFSNAQLRCIDNDIRSLDFEIIKQRHKKIDTTSLEAKKKELELKFEKKLKEFGHSTIELKPIFDCPYCQDQGRVKGQYCACFKKLFVQEVKKISNLEVVAPFKFSDCSFDFVKDTTQRKHLKTSYEYARAYCKNFSATKTCNFFLSGSTGVGKTCIASAVANELAERCYTVLFKSAFNMLSDMKDNYFSNHNLKEENLLLQDYLTCDLLVIDDLGTEQILRNITLEYLLLILSERELHNKSTLITTNLSMNHFIDRYGDRITSRLTNTSKTLIRNLEGYDLRNQQRN